MKDIPDKSIDMILCDLPYGITKNKWDCVIPFRDLWDAYNRIAKDNAAIVLFGSGMFTADLMHSNRKMWRYNIIWEKTQPTGFLNAKRMPLRSHEDILVFYKKLPTYNPQMMHGYPRKVSSAESKRNCKETTNYGGFKPKSYDSTDRYPRSVWKYKTDKQISALHPTQKPIELLSALIKTYTNKGDIVLDNCMGCGSTCIACIEADRKYIGFEIDEKYFEIAKERISRGGD